MASSKKKSSSGKGKRRKAMAPSGETSIRLRVSAQGVVPGEHAALVAKMLELSLAATDKKKKRPLPPSEAPTNACHGNPACEYIGWQTDDQGVVWYVYVCNGEIIAYRAGGT